MQEGNAILTLISIHKRDILRSCHFPNRCISRLLVSWNISSMCCVCMKVDMSWLMNEVTTLNIKMDIVLILRSKVTSYSRFVYD